MTIWSPDLEPHNRPRYLAIVHALEDDVRAGVLAEGDRLPTHRALAESLGLSVGTVTKAYREATRRKLVEGLVGRGTFVRDRAGEVTRWAIDASPDASQVDLSILLSPPVVEDALGSRIREALVRAVGDAALRQSLDYQPHAGHERHRVAATRWLARAGLDVEPEEVFVCAGAQHAAMLTLSALVDHDDVVFTEELTTPGIKDLAGWMQFRLQGLPCDEAGIVPDAFEEACRHVRGRALYTMPTLQNPTTVTMPESRRAALGEIAERHGVPIVEDGVHGLLGDPDCAPLAALAPSVGYYLTSFSKTLAPGLRVGYLRVPDSARRRVEEAMRASVWMASPLLAEIATRWIADGTADRVLERRRAEADERQAVAKDVLGDYDLRMGRGGFHTFFHLPTGWDPSSFVAAAKRHGVLITPADTFTAHRGHAPSAVRICLGGPAGLDELRKGLTVLGELLVGEGRDPAREPRPLRKPGSPLPTRDEIHER